MMLGEGRHKRGGISSVRGFTLIELLVVVTVIALLVALLLPALEEAREAAREVICATNLKAGALGLALYSEDNNGYLPAFGRNTPGVSWMYTIGPYMEQSDPSQSRGFGFDYMRCPSAREPVPWPYNSTWGDYGAHYGWVATGMAPFSTSGPSRYVETRKTFLLADAQVVASFPSPYFYPMALVMSWVSDPSDEYWRHRDRYNFVYYDTHVRTVERTDFIADYHAATYGK